MNRVIQKQKGKYLFYICGTKIRKKNGRKKETKKGRKKGRKEEVMCLGSDLASNTKVYKLCLHLGQ